MARFVTAIAVFFALGSAALARNTKELKADLVGYEEAPAISTAASGEFRARIANDENSISYELSYADLEGSVTQAHIHFGQVGVAAGISVWLCGNNPPTSPPAGTQSCPESPATITGTITQANVVGPTAQGIAAGEFAELIAAIRAERAYVNVHSTKFTSGEIRGQIDPGLGQEH